MDNCKAKKKDGAKDYQAGIHLSIKNQNMSLIGQLYYYQCQCFEKKNTHVEDIKKSYKQALYFLELLGNNTYVEIIKKLKYNYLDIAVSNK